MEIFESKRKAEQVALVLRIVVWSVLLADIGFSAFFLEPAVRVVLSKVIIAGGGALLIDRELIGAKTVLGYKVLLSPCDDASSDNVSYRRLALATGVIAYALGVII